MSGPARGVEAALAFATVNRVSMGLLFGCAGRLNSQNRWFPARAVMEAAGNGKLSRGRWRHFHAPLCSIRESPYEAGGVACKWLHRPRLRGGWTYREVSILSNPFFK